MTEPSSKSEVCPKCLALSEAGGLDYCAEHKSQPPVSAPECEMKGLEVSKMTDSAQPTPSEGLKEHTLRCPFCGELPDETDAQEFGDNYAVECPGCHASGPIAEYPDWAFGQWERRVAQGQSTARNQDGRLREARKTLEDIQNLAHCVCEDEEKCHGCFGYKIITACEKALALTASPEVKE